MKLLTWWSRARSERLWIDGVLFGPDGGPPTITPWMWRPCGQRKRSRMPA